MNQNTSQSMGSRKAQAKGAMFEQIIDISCQYYRRFGKADIQKTPEPMSIIRAVDRRRGIFEAHFAKKAQPDFKGVLAGGQMIIFEAKRTENALIAYNRISDEQADNFRRCAKLGADCFVLVSFSERHFYKVPWHIWDGMQQIYRKKSVNEKDLAEYEVPYINGMIQFL